MRLPHKREMGGIKNSQKMKSAFFDCLYVMPPLKKGVHYTPPNPGCRQLSGWVLGYDAGRSQTQAYFHDKMGHSAVHEHLQTLRRWYKVKRREAPPSQPTCSSGALRSVGCFGCANSRLSSVIAQKQMCAKYRTLPCLIMSQSFFFISASTRKFTP